ncbi:putative lipid II flippase MurJ [Desulfomarina profundi]|uniref:Probable lipid II flippase MurJ n=1 Tax=Desulfomarina profundi TaxID=2772557 RepID=A0A8D5FVN2_9BACT|nr:murein biosynthesis integral membrane protein MurJ [Desulfomarina profundi]BCL60737.1 putative lipid II flippase MurJ [Desulfomarina profundi]
MVSVAVMCSRLLGLVREQVFASLFGAGFAYDSFVVAFRIPNLLRDLFGEGALSAAFVTVFSDYDTNKSREETWKLASTVLTFIAVLLSIITLLGIYFSGSIVSLLAPDFDLIAGKSELTRKLTVVMLPFLIVISLSAVVMGMLNTRGRFFIPALASSFFNLGSIIGGTSLAFILPRYGQPAIMGMACGTLIGGILQLGIQLPSLYKTGYRYKPVLNLSDTGLKRILKLMVPATIGLSATQINIFINTNFASSCAEGSVSWLNYAFRLVQLPIGLFGVALSIAMLPVLAKQAARKDIMEMKETMVSSLTMVLALTVPATFGLIILAEPIIRLIFEHGAFTEADTVATARTLAFYAVGLFAYSANKVLVPAFYALDKTKYPVVASFLAIGTNIVFITLTIDTYQHLAIAMSTSCTMILNFIFLFTTLHIKMQGFRLKYLARALLKILCAAAGLLAVLLAGQSVLETVLHTNRIVQFLAVMVLIGVSAAVYGVILYLFKLEEMTVFIQQIKEKVSPAK